MVTLTVFKVSKKSKSVELKISSAISISVVSTANVQNMGKILLLETREGRISLNKLRIRTNKKYTLFFVFKSKPIHRLAVKCFDFLFVTSHI